MPTDDPFSYLEPVRAVGAAPSAEDDPFEALPPPRVPQHLLRPNTGPTPAFTNLLYGAAKGVAGPVQAGAELAGLDDELERNVMQPLRERYYSSDAYWTPGADVMRGVGEILPWLAVRRLPGARSLGRVADRIPLLRRPGLQRTAHDAALGGVAGGLGYAQPGSDQSRLDQAQTGALVAGAAGPVVRGLAGGVVRLRNAVEGKFEPSAQPVMDTARRYGVRLSPTDPNPQRYPGLTQRAIRAEKQPTTGVASFRTEQAADVNRAAQQLQARYAGDFMEDWPAAAQESMIQRAGRMRTMVGAKYDRLARLAADKPGVEASKAIEQIDTFLEREAGKVMPDEALIKELEGLKESLSSGPLGFERLRDFRSDLGLELKKYYRGQNSIIGEKGALLYARLRRAVDKDMETWARAQGGDIEVAWRDADRTYRGFARTYRKQQIAALKDVDDPVQLYDRFKTLAVRQPTALYNALGPEGRRAIRYGLVRDAVDGATRTTPTGEAVSPARLAARLEKMERSIGITFGEAGRREIDGFVKLMRAAERSGQFMEYPPTGVRNMFALGNLARGGSLGVAYMIGGLPLVGGVFAGMAANSVLTRVMFTTKAGQRLLLAASHLDPRGEGMRKLITEQLPKVLAVHATAEDAIPWPKADPRNLPAELRETLYQQPPGVAVKDQETGLLYALDPSGNVRVIE